MLQLSNTADVMAVVGLLLGGANLYIVLRVQLAVEQLRNQITREVQEKLEQRYYDRDALDAKLAELRGAIRGQRNAA